MAAFIKTWIYWTIISVSNMMGTWNLWHRVMYSPSFFSFSLYFVREDEEEEEMRCWSSNYGREDAASWSGKSVIELLAI